MVLACLRWQPCLRPSSLLLAGIASGVGGTAASIGGPLIALLYQRAAGSQVRGTLGGYFVVGSIMSITALVGTGQVSAG